MTSPFIQTAYFLESYKSGGSYKGEKGVGTELKNQLTSGKVGRSVKLLAQLRELTPFLADGELFDENYLTMMNGLINQVKDNDNDGRKALRLVYYHMTETVANLKAERRVSPLTLDDVFDNVLRDIASSASCPPHRHLALRTAGLLSSFLDDPKQSVDKLTKVIEDLSAKCRQHANAVRPVGKMLKKAKEYLEITYLSSAVGSIVRRIRGCPPGYMLLVVALCCLDNDDAARHGFAALSKFAAEDPDGVSVHFHPRLRATSEEHADGPLTLTLRDTLACVYYLRMCAHMAFAAPTSERHTEKMRDEFYRTLYRSIGDSRLRVSLEAVRGLFGFGLQSYQRAAAMEAKQALPVLSKCTQYLTQALKTSKDGNDLPALHSVLRTMLLVVRILQEGNARCPAPPLGRSPAKVSGPIDFFAPPSPSLNDYIPYVEDMRAIGQAIIGAGLTESSHPSLRATSLRILIWQAPPRAQVAGAEVWPWVRMQMDSAIACATDFQLGQLLQDCLDRLDLHAQSLGAAITTTALGAAEHYFKRAPSDPTGALILRVWSFCLGKHAALSAALVLASLFRVLDHNVMDVKGLTARSEAVWELQGMHSPGLSEARSALARLKRLSVGFLGYHITSFRVEHMSPIILRLQTLSIYADYHTRCSAVSTLCKAAASIDDLEVKLTIYEFLHSLEVAEFDLNTCPDVKEEVTSLPEVQGQAVDYLDQGGGLCMKDIIAPCMQHLHTVLDRLLEQQKGSGVGTPSTGLVDMMSLGAAPRGAGTTVSPVMVMGSPTLKITQSPVPVLTAPVKTGSSQNDATNILDFF